MIRARNLIAATAIALAAGLMTAGAAPAVQDDFDEYYYDYTFYSDATKTIVVGSYSQYCWGNKIIMTPQVTGQTSAHYDRYLKGRCPGLGDW